MANLSPSANKSLEQIRVQMDLPLPTAPVGTNVQWFEMNEDERCYAALVTRIEGPGKVQVVVFRPNAMPQHRQGVLHRSHPVHKNRHATETMRNGAWDYPPGVNPLKGHRELHLKELKRREAAILEQERINAEIAARGVSERAITP